MTLAVVRRAARGDARALGAGLHPVLRRVYGGRGLCDPAELRLTLDRLLPVGSLAGVAAAAELLARHRQGSRVLIVGDFDADGATSTALMVRALRDCGFAAVDFLVPNRFEYGYGLTPEIVELAAARAPGLLVTVDNGISSNAGVAAARARGIEVLVTDHHLPGAELPAANVLVNPEPRARRGRRGLLRACRAGTAPRGGRPHAGRRAAAGALSRPRGARHGGRCRSARRQ
jgi:single-stranded-DNA-specific exonuclease